MSVSDLMESPAEKEIDWAIYERAVECSIAAGEPISPDEIRCRMEHDMRPLPINQFPDFDTEGDT